MVHVQTLPVVGLTGGIEIATVDLKRGTVGQVGRGTGLEGPVGVPLVAVGLTDGIGIAIVDVRRRMIGLVGRGTGRRDPVGVPLVVVGLIGGVKIAIVEVRRGRIGLVGRTTGLGSLAGILVAVGLIDGTGIVEAKPGTAGLMVRASVREALVGILLVVVGLVGGTGCVMMEIMLRTAGLLARASVQGGLVGILLVVDRIGGLATVILADGRGIVLLVTQGTGREGGVILLMMASPIAGTGTESVMGGLVGGTGIETGGINRGLVDLVAVRTIDFVAMTGGPKRRGGVMKISVRLGRGWSGAMMSLRCPYFLRTPKCRGVCGPN